MKRFALFLLGFGAFAAAPTAEIKLDQAGYLPGSPKVALVVSGTASEEFTVRRAGGDAVVFRGKLGSPAGDPDSGDRVRAADFSAFNQNGRYYLEVPGTGRSWDFTIGPDVYSRAWYLATRSFYGQRCGTAVDLGAEFPGYSHPACHLEGAFHPSSGKSGPVKPSRGWHDAGDYGRYVVNSGISTGTLLWTWELFGARLKSARLNIPESGNGTPDLLNEIRWNVDWMLTMQDEDGGVWHKQTSERFCGFIPPDKDTFTSFIIGTGSGPFKSSCATADFAAVTAIAARAYKSFDAAYAETCLRAARKAWTWLEKNPNVLFRNPERVSTGAYGDRDCADERLWAAAELWRSTRDDVYQRYFLANYAAFLPKAATPPAWGMVAPLALWTYALGKPADGAAAGAVCKETARGADELVTRAERSGYRTTMTTRDYIWGSNSVAANYGLQLLVANALGANRRYVDTALENLHYLLGRNAVSLSFVTQVGANPFRHPHHRPSASVVEPWPGLLSGGPNRSKQDPAMKRMPDLPPAKMYLDQQESYASNEICINWNAPLVFVLAGALPEGK